MSMSKLIKNSLKQSILALGDLVLAVKIAQEIPTTPEPGEDYIADYSISAGKGVFEAVNYKDFPDSQVMIGDRTLLLLEFTVDVKNHDWINVGETTYHVYGVKPDMVGMERVLQKLLVRAEPKEIVWESDDPEVVTA